MRYEHMYKSELTVDAVHLQLSRCTSAMLPQVNSTIVNPSERQEHDNGLSSSLLGSYLALNTGRSQTATKCPSCNHSSAKSDTKRV